MTETVINNKKSNTHSHKLDRFLAICALIVAWLPLHVWSVNIAHREDYLQAGLRYFPINLEVRDAVKVLLVFSLVLYGVSIALYFVGGFSWLYLAVVMDLYSRKIVGWALSNSLKTPLVKEALTMAYWQRKPGKGLIHHSDRGSQYASYDYQDLLNTYGMRCSMSRKGDCWDNAVVESFFRSLKTERTDDVLYRTRSEARRDVFDYIEMFYNSNRLHSYLGYKTPNEFEKNSKLAKAA